MTKPTDLITEAREARSGFSPTTGKKTKAQIRAEWEAAKKLAKKGGQMGRPRKEGPRDDKGRLLRPRAKDPRRVVLEKRAAMAGVTIATGKPIDAETEATLRAEWMGCAPGRAIAKQKDAPILWAAIKRIRAIVAAYRRAIGNGTGHPAIMRLPVTPSDEAPFGESPTADLRSEVERYDAAMASYDALMSDAWLLGPGGQMMLIDVVCAETADPPTDFPAIIRRLVTMWEETP